MYAVNEKAAFQPVMHKKVSFLGTNIMHIAEDLIGSLEFCSNFSIC